MHTAFDRVLDRPEWAEERLRYRVLRSVYDHAGGSLGRIVAADQLITGSYGDQEEMHRALGFLDHHGYLISVGDGPRICITTKGIEYIEKAAGRRRSLRAAA